MKHLTQQYDETIYSSNAFEFYFGDLDIGILDIETTGLNPSRNKFILGGLFDLQTKTMHQLFAENRGEEREALKAFYDMISQLDMVITYNGRHFDMPFIEKRLKLHGFGGRFKADTEQTAFEAYLPYNLDIYLMINGHSPIKRLVPNLKQKTVENYMGLWQSRTDEISGAESVALYNRYENTGSSQLESRILLHNSDDVLQLTRLMKVIGKCDIHKAMYHLGFPVFAESHESTGGSRRYRLMVKKIRTEKNSLMVSGIQMDNAMEYTGFSFGDFPVESRFSRRSATFDMKLPIIRDSGLCIADLDAAGLQRSDFEKYPSCSSGFLVIENHDIKNFQETNHFIKAFLNAFMNNI